MDFSAGSYFSSWPVNSASESYSLADGSVESYGGEGSMPPSSYFMTVRSDHNLKFSVHEQDSTMLPNEQLTYAGAGQTDLLPGDTLSRDKLCENLLGLQRLQNNSNLQSNLVAPGVLQHNSTPGVFHPQLNTPGLSELPHALSSSIDSNGSEVSAFLADVNAVSSAPTLCSAFQNASSFMEPVNLEAFSFQGAQSDSVLNKTCHPNGDISVFDSATLASLHDSKEFITGRLPSFASVQEANLASSGFKTQKQEQNAMCNVPIPAFIARNQMSVAATQGALIPQKIPSWINENKSEGPVSHPSDVQTQPNSAGNGVGVKPRVRARRGQATDPHSIAERLRREKISDRMKSLQDLLPGDTLSRDKLCENLLGLQRLQNNSNLQSNLVAPGVLQHNSTPGVFHPQLNTPGLSELPHALSSSIDSNGSEVSAFLADVNAVSSAPTLCSAFQNASSFMEPVNLEAFSFQGAQSDSVLNKTCHPNGDISVFDSATLASLHDSKEFITGRLPSFASVQEANLASSGFKTQKQEQNAMCNVPIPAFIARNQMSVAATQGALIPQKIPSWINENKSEGPVSHPSDVQTQPNSAGNGVGVKPRVRARRGQATDPHSIAERLRREKISDRMKSLQDLLPGDTLSRDKLCENLLGLQRLQNNSNLQSNLVAPGVLQHNSTPGVFHPQLNTPGLSELPHALSSSIDSNGSEVSAFLADVNAVSSAPTLCSAFQNASSFMEPVNLEAFSFQGAQSDSVLNKTCHPNGDISVFDSATLASLHDSKEFITGRLPSFASVQEANLASSGFKTQKQEQNAMCNVPIPAFIARNQMSVAATQGALIPQKIPSWINENKSEGPVSHPSDVQTQPNSAGNGVGVKPRVRARRGQATDPHSIAERLRREKISDRMKSLQDLVPNSNKADKASMLDEIIDYVKFLQLQVKVLSMSRLGAPGAVLPLLTESQTEGYHGQPLSAPTNAQGLLDALDSEDAFIFEEEVVKLMETSITSAMQYLQNKGLCLMPVALASAISTQKGVSAAAIPPER